jgi:hypothetical protein
MSWQAPGRSGDIDYLLAPECANHGERGVAMNHEPAEWNSHTTEAGTMSWMVVVYVCPECGARCRIRMTLKGSSINLPQYGPQDAP